MPASRAGTATSASRAPERARISCYVAHLTNAGTAVRRLALGSALGATGWSAAGIALSAEVFERTGSAVWLSFSFFLSFGIVGLLHPVAGAISDRYDRKRVMVVSELASAAVWLLLIPVDAPTGLLALGFFGSLTAAPLRTAVPAAVPNIVGGEDLNRANASLAVGRNIGRIAGPAIGGAAFVWVGPDALYGANAATMIATAVLIASIQAPFSSRGADGTQGDGSGMAVWDGLRHLWGDPATRSLFVVWVLLYLTVDVALVADLPIAEEFGWGSFGYGLIATASGVGALLGSIAARKITEPFEPWAVLTGAAGIGVGYLVVALAPVFAFVLFGNFLWAALDAGDEVAGTSIFQRRTPDEIRGRVFGAVGMGGLLANAIGFTFAGFLVDAAGPKATYAICGIASFLVIPLLIPMFRALAAMQAAETEP